MSERFLTILEVSQKQNYIFASNKLRDNITNSAVISWVTSAEYFVQTVKDSSIFNITENYVYSGGGHTVLEFLTKEHAVEFTRKITGAVRKEYPGIEVFATTVLYNEDITPGQNLKKLTGQLEMKKAERKAAFHQGSFGIEKIDTNTLRPLRAGEVFKNKMPEAEEKTDVSMSPKAFHQVYKFEELGGSKNESNFIAVVHIDGNAMGKRVEQFAEKHQSENWDSYKTKLRAFSRAIDDQFKEAYRDMVATVEKNLTEGRLAELDIVNDAFPIRRIITAGDDICFVTEGRIGLECAAIFLKNLTSKVNPIDGESYSACAGVAIVHQKYPFYKAYELAEMLCSNAKKYGASISPDGSGKEISAIDWHLEFGEMKDTLELIRKQYVADDGRQLVQRPYLVNAPENILEAHAEKKYEAFRQLVEEMSYENFYARSNMKELRNVLKQGKTTTEYFLRFHSMNELLDKHELLFDAIEVIDTYLKIEY